MRYVLFLAIGSQPYKGKHAKVRIFADNNFIDEFEVDPIWNESTVPVLHREQLKNAENFRFYQRYDTELERLHELKNLKIYEISLPVRDAQITIELQNDYNNYTNGFITQFTKVRLDYFLVVPVKLFSYSNQSRIGWSWKFNRRNYLPKGAMKTKKYYRKRFSLCKNQANNMTFYPNMPNGTTYSGGLDNHVIGQSGKFVCNLYKKQNIHWPAKFKGFCLFQTDEVIEFLKNKYNYNENQRSSD